METKGDERINEEGAVETKVETVDYRTPAGHEHDQEPKKEKVEVVHLTRSDDDTAGTKASRVLVDAAAAVASKVDSAKDAISGSGGDK